MPLANASGWCSMPKPNASARETRTNPTRQRGNTALVPGAGSAKIQSMDATAFLAKPLKGKPQPVYVLYGEEDFLRREARARLEPFLLEGADRDFALASYEGDTADWSVVRSELETLPFLSPRRIVVVEQADDFVSEHRSKLEAYVAKPSAGTLILEMRSWPSNTKLAKALGAEVAISCKAPTGRELTAWCIQRAHEAYGKKLAGAAAQLLVTLSDPALGLLDQELAKLASYVGARAGIVENDVAELVGRNREAEVFKIFEAVGQGNSVKAFGILAQLKQDGEDVHRIFGAFSWQLRRLAQAHRQIAAGTPINRALLDVGVKEFALHQTEQLMRHLGQRRLDALFDWMLEIDLGFKGDSDAPPMLLLERLLVRLARPREAAVR